MMKMDDCTKVFLRITLFAVAACGYGAQANDLVPDMQLERGRAIAKESSDHDIGFEDFSAEVEMTLKNKSGTESQRRFRISVLEVGDDGDKSLIVFDRPRDVSGTALLTFSHKAKNDEQWVFLPALKRVKRISSTNKSGPFVGSEFAYEDMVWPEFEKYSYRWLRDENLGGVPVHVVERAPNYKNSGYSRQLVWYDTAELRIIKIEFFDRKGGLLKVLAIRGYQLYKDNFWRAGEMHMSNIQNGKSTRLVWKDYSFSNGLSDGAFQMGKLKRIR